MTFRINSKNMFFTWGNMTVDRKVDIERLLKGIFGRKSGYQYYIAH